MEGLCGGALWNESFTLNADNPYLTPCFESTILAWVPAAFLLIGIPFEISAYQSSIDRHLPLSVLSMTKLLMSLGLAGVTVAELLLLEESVSSWKYVGPAVGMVAYLLTTIMTLGAMRNGVITSGPQFVFWLVDSICRALAFSAVANTYIEADLPKEGPIRDKFILASVDLLGSVVLLLLNSFADKTTNVEYVNSRKPCPEYSIVPPSSTDWCSIGVQASCGPAGGNPLLQMTFGTSTRGLLQHPLCQNLRGYSTSRTPNTKILHKTVLKEAKETRSLRFQFYPCYGVPLVDPLLWDLCFSCAVTSSALLQAF